ncbi:MAG: BMP family ABC transporter substrate-binding protein [Anaerolineaceae bacterium]|nr:BMP family ABC transporter substrate-binding protein [Anaerolineaceae bacterium]
MFSKFLSKEDRRLPRMLWLLLLLVLSLAMTQCTSSDSGDAEETSDTADTTESTDSADADASDGAADASDDITLAILHFSVIEGTTWSGAHDRAGERLAEKYDNVNYVFREEVGPDLTVPYGEELISAGADIVIGNAEFMGLPLQDITEKYPDVYFGSIIASDLATERNFIRLFPRQYQALYLEGLIAGALTETGNIGIVSAFPSVQVIRRTNGFVLGVQDAAEILGKDINIYVRYAGDWFLPPEERGIAETLISEYNVDVITQQTDSGSPLDVAVEQGIWFVGKDMDIVGFYGWADTNTVAVSFDTRWEVLYDSMIQDFMAGEQNPETVLYLGMESSITLADGTEIPTVDIMNDGKVGLDAISPCRAAVDSAGDFGPGRAAPRADDCWRMGPIHRARLYQQWHWPGTGRAAYSSGW